MTKYLEEITQTKQTWSYPVLPQPNDQSWVERFTAADELGKSNLAKAWLWSVHTQAQSAHVSTKMGTAVSCALDNPSVFRLLVPYIDTKDSYAANIVFDGSFETVFQVASRSEEMDRETLGYYIDVFKDAWLESGEARIDAVTELVESITIDMGVYFSFGELYNLSACLAWDAIAKEDVSTELLDKTIALTLTFAEKEIGVPNGATETQRALHRLAYHAIHLNSLTSRNRFSTEDKDFLQKLPDTSLAKAVISIFEKMIDVNIEPWLHDTGNPLFSSSTKTKTVFDALRYWIPAQNVNWDMAESLGLTAEDLVSFVDTLSESKTTAQMQLPENFDIGVQTP